MGYNGFVVNEDKLQSHTFLESNEDIMTQCFRQTLEMCL